ncbi:MAG: ribonuclease HII [Clostridia bacterium]|nr:ribonuclease HII [Clostridia bacterium]
MAGPTWQLEEAWWARGARLVAGVDEVGRGPLAGPVVAAAVVLDPARAPAGLRDSKRLSPQAREALDPRIRAAAVTWGIGLASSAEVDRLNVRQASFLAMRRALAQLRPRPDAVLVDGFAIPGCELPQEAVPGGDDRSVSIAAASILAKVYRDRLMEAYARHYPGYGFEVHKGYPTSLHRRALSRLGPSPLHRLTYTPVAALAAAAAPSGAGASAFGAWAEARVAAYLAERGLRLVERNYRCRFGEIDLVMRDGSDLVFVEVRARSSAAFGGPEETVGARKRSRLVRLALAYLAERGLAEVGCRFDVVALCGPSGEEVRWFRDAFRPGGS